MKTLKLIFDVSNSNLNDVEIDNLNNLIDKLWDFDHRIDEIFDGDIKSLKIKANYNNTINAIWKVGDVLENNKIEAIRDISRLFLVELSQNYEEIYNRELLLDGKITIIEQKD